MIWLSFAFVVLLALVSVFLACVEAAYYLSLIHI